MRTFSILAIIVGAVLGGLNAGAFAQPIAAAAAGDRLSGIVLPVEPLEGDIRLRALRADAWTVEETKRLLLRGDVRIDVGRHAFEGDAAVVWLNRIPSAGGLINQIAIFLPQLQDPTRGAGVGVDGREVLITGSARGDVTLDVALLEEGRPRGEPLLARAERRLALHVQQILAQPTPLRQRPVVDPVTEPQRQPWVPLPGEPLPDAALAPPPPDPLPLPPAPEPAPWLRDPSGRVLFSAERIEFTPGSEENVITAEGALSVQYLADEAGEFTRLTLTAERGVIFTDPGGMDELAERELSADAVRGIYLEGAVQAVADEFEYAVRAPRVYYDFRTGRAIMLDAVLRTYARELGRPIYARAEEMRQIAEDQWTARQVVVSTSEFYTPHIALGAERMHIARRPGEDERVPQRTYFTSEDNTLRLGGTPVFWWPRFRGQIEDTPLRAIGLSTRRDVGVGVESVWDVFALMGEPRPTNLDLTLRLDAYSERGVGAGLGTEYLIDDGAGFGEAELYGIYDTGEDERLTTGRDVEVEKGLRGVALWAQHYQPNPLWTIQTQASYISDETFIPFWRRDDFRERREFETSLYLKRQEESSALTFLVKDDLYDFIANDYLLASRQYQVEKLPELTLRHYGWQLFDGAVTYSAETRLSRMALSFEESTPREVGLRGLPFGLDADTPFAEALRMRGYSSQYVMRGDTRHEFTMPFDWGPLRLVPFIVGRLTAYSEDFDEFSSDSEAMRAYAAAGVRLATQIMRIDNAVENRLFDLHRLRHIIEPSMTLWYGYSNVTQDDLPTYNEQVESLASGPAVRLGVRNTWQTQRGGPGRWESVDVLTINTDFVFTDAEDDDGNGLDRESPTPQWFDYRPEYSQFGDHFYGSFIWQASDTLAFVGEVTHDLDESELARGSVGFHLQHSPLFSTYVEYRTIDVSDTRLLGIGWYYQITPKYRLDLRPQWDVREGEFRSINARLIRSFPDVQLILRLDYDAIIDDTTIGATLGLAPF